MMEFTSNKQGKNVSNIIFMFSNDMQNMSFFYSEFNGFWLCLN